jgi:death-on-curing protein
MRYLSVSEILDLYVQVMQQTGGSVGLRDPGSLESAVAQPRQTFSGKELYPTLAEKAGALGHSLVQNHAFVDGNKRIAHAAMEVFLRVNGYELSATVDAQERVMLDAASGKIERAEFISWVVARVVVKE